MLHGPREIQHHEGALLVELPELLERARPRLPRPVVLPVHLRGAGKIRILRSFATGLKCLKYVYKHLLEGA